MLRRAFIRLTKVLACGFLGALSGYAQEPQAPRTLAEEALLSNNGAGGPALLAAATDDAQVAREIARLKQLAREGQLEAARAGADALVSRFPHEPCAYAIRGLFSAEAKDFARANGDLDQALSLAPKSGVIRFGRARALSRQGRADEAIDELKQCANLSGANLELVATLHRLKRTDEAKQYAEHLVSARPNDAKTQALLAQVDLWCGNYEAAVTAASQAIELDPSNAELWYLRAQCLLGREDIDGAKADIAESIRRAKDPVARAAQYGFLATIDYLRGDLESAYANSSAAVRENSTDADYLRIRAVVQVRRKQYQQAHDDLTLAIDGIISGKLTTAEKDGLAAFYRERASVAIFRFDSVGQSQDYAEYKRLREEAANKEARKP